MHELATCVSSDVVTVNTICPGLIYIGFSSFFPFLLCIPVDLIMAIRARPVAVDTRLVINAAVSLMANFLKTRPSFRKPLYRLDVLRNTFLIFFKAICTS